MLINYIRNYVKKNMYFLIVAIITYGLYSVASTASALLLGKIIDYASMGELKNLLITLLFTLGIVIVAYVLYIASSYTEDRFAANCAHETRMSLVRSIFNRGLVRIHNKNDAYYMNMLNEDVNNFKSDYYHSLPLLAFNLLGAIFTLAALIYVSPKASLIFAGLLIIPMIIPSIVNKTLPKKTEMLSKKNEEYIFEIKEQVQGLDEIVSNSAKDKFINKFSFVSLAQQKATVSLNIARDSINELNNTMGSVGQIACMAVGGVMVIKGELSVGDMIIILQFINSAFNYLQKVTSYINSIASSIPLRKKLLEELNSPNEMDGNIGIESGEIEYENVNVYYLMSDENNSDNEIRKDIIRDFSSVIRTGECCAIVGESGKGKTTLMKVLLKMIDTFSGQVRIGRININDISSNQLYKVVSYVPQNIYLFNDTIKNNIIMNNDVSQDKFNEIIKKTRLEKLLLETKTEIGDAGEKISGGEKQRIGIARALMKQPKIIVFDEPASALDPITRDMINELIFSLNDYTRIVITHDCRDEYLKKFDKVISL